MWLLQFIMRSIGFKSPPKKPQILAFCGAPCRTMLSMKIFGKVKPLVGSPKNGVHSQWMHSLISGVLIQSCSAGAKNFPNYIFCHVQFSGVIQNIENHCAIRAKFWKNLFLLYKIGYFDNNWHMQIGVIMEQQFSIFWITTLNCTWQNI